MVTFATTKLSSKGQVVIPQEIRTKLGLKTGSKFMVMTAGDGVMFRLIHPFDRERFDVLLAAARKSAKAAGLKPSDVTKTIRRVRASKRSAL